MGILLLSPQPPPIVREPRPGPPLESLGGARIGFRVEYIWPAYHRVAARWPAALAERGATTRTWSSDTHLDAAGGSGMAEFADGLDLAVVELGNCGSCTSWAVHDTVAVLERGRAAVCVVTAEFESLAAQVAERAGWPGMRLVVLPFPLVTLPEKEIEEVADEHLGRLLRACGLPVRVAAG